MPPSLPDLFQALDVQPPHQVGGLQVFGLRCPGDGGLDYTTLDEAMQSGQFEVTEVNEGGSVPTLKVINKGDRLVFLMAGEQLVGAKQNRVLNASILVPAQRELPIPVSCVEAGRWRYSSRSFSHSDSSSHYYLRTKMSKAVTRSYKASSAPRSDQGEVWAEVSRKLARMGSHSDSAALEQTYQDYRDRLEQILQQLQPPQDCHGAVFAFGGRIAGLDLFDKPTTLAKLWPKLIRAYAIDALEEGSAEAAVSADQVKQWLTAAASVPAQPFKSPGLGDDVRLEGQGVVGAGLVVEQQPVHVELFSDVTPQT
jgi:hypothetical protein